MRHLWLFLLTLASSGQPVVVSAGFNSQWHLDAVPGELVTFRLAGLGDNAVSAFFSSEVPLPFEVNGLRVTLKYPVWSISGEEPVSYPAAIHSIRSDGGLTAITVQIPPEIVTSGIEATSRPTRPDAEIAFWHQDNALTTVPLQLYRQRIRLVGTCDLRFEDVPLWNPKDCYPIYYDENGERPTKQLAGGQKIRLLVSGFRVPRNEGRPGVIWKSGWPNPEEQGTATGGLYLTQMGQNLLGVQPWPSFDPSIPSGPTVKPFVWVRPIPGEYGLGYAEITLPNVPEGVATCPNRRDTYTSNVTITLDIDATLRLCVAPTPQTAAAAAKNGDGK